MPGHPAGPLKSAPKSAPETAPARAGDRNSPDANIISLLSLNLLLLGFFILLTSLSSYEDDRKRLVLESVDEAFNGRVHAARSYNDTSSGLGNLDQMEVLMGEVGELFSSALPVVRVERAADAPVVSFALPAETLFAPGSTDLRPGRWLLLRRLVEALADGRHSALAYELTVFHGVAAGAMPESAPGRPDALEPRRLGALARSLVARGLPAENLSVGLRPGAAGSVRFVLRVGPPET